MTREPLSTPATASISDLLERAQRVADAACVAVDTATLDSEIPWRRAARKGWIAASSAAVAVLEARAGTRPRTTQRRRDALNDLARTSGSGARLQMFASGFASAYSDLGILHLQDCNPLTIRRRLQEVRDELVPLARRLSARQAARARSE